MSLLHIVEGMQETMVVGGGGNCRVSGEGPDLATK
jgi:hypothetical protein